MNFILSIFLFSIVNFFLLHTFYTYRILSLFVRLQIGNRRFNFQKYFKILTLIKTRDVDFPPVNLPFLLRHRIHLRSAHVQSNCTDAFRGQAITPPARSQATLGGLRYQGLSYRDTKAADR